MMLTPFGNAKTVAPGMGKHIPTGVTRPGSKDFEPAIRNATVVAPTHRAGRMEESLQPHHEHLQLQRHLLGPSPVSQRLIRLGLINPILLAFPRVRLTVRVERSDVMASLALAHLQLKVTARRKRKEAMFR